MFADLRRLIRQDVTDYLAIFYWLSTFTLGLLTSIQFWVIVVLFYTLAYLYNLA